jgi:hypothetical protein
LFWAIEGECQNEILYLIIEGIVIHGFSLVQLTVSR